MSLEADPEVTPHGTAPDNLNNVPPQLLFVHMVMFVAVAVVFVFFKSYNKVFHYLMFTNIFLIFCF